MIVACRWHKAARDTVDKVDEVDPESGRFEFKFRISSRKSS